MSLVWKRLQRYNKRAGKFKFTIAYHELEIECDPGVKALPKNVRIVWTRRGRRVESSVQSWHPTLTNPLRGTASWPTTELKELIITLFRDPRADSYDDKDWKIQVEDASDAGRKKPLATLDVNVSKYVSGTMSQHEDRLVLKAMTKKIKESVVSCTISCLFLKEGQAMDDDMMSVASLVSSAQYDIARMEDIQDDDEVSAPTPTGSVLNSFTTELNQMVSDLHERAVDVEPRSSDGILLPDSGIGNRKALKPLELQPVASESSDAAHKPMHPPLRVLERSNTIETPSQDLQSWAQEVTRGYRGVKVTNMTTSWRNGMAFCAIFHKFRPDLIDYDSLKPTETKVNCQIAFEAGEKLGIPRVIMPEDMVFLAVPDKLAVMTYLHQVKAYFTGESLRVKSVVDQSARFEVEKSEPVVTAAEVTTSEPKSPDAETRPEISPVHVQEKARRSSSSDNEEKGFAKFSAKFFQKRWKRSSSKDKPAPEPQRSTPSTPSDNISPHRLLESGDSSFRSNSTPPQRSETAPEGLRLESPSHVSPGSGRFEEKPKSRQEQIRERARNMQKEAKGSSSVDELPSGPTDNRSLARKLLEDARKSASNSSPFVRSVTKSKISNVATTSPEKKSPARIMNPRSSLRRYNKKHNRELPPEAPASTEEKTTSPTKSVASNESLSDSLNVSDFKPVQPVKLASFDPSGAKRTTSATVVKSRPTFPNGNSFDHPFQISNGTPAQRKSAYIQRETEAIELEQAKIDRQASKLEERVRNVMKKNEEGLATEEEEELLLKWFNLVNEKSALLRRQMQLNVMAKEENLERRYEMLNQELREMFSTDENQKTDYEREREQMLLAELVELVDERDLLVHQMHEEGQRMDEEQEIAADVSRASFRAKGNHPPPATRLGFSATLPRGKFNGTSASQEQDGDKNCILQ